MKWARLTFLAASVLTMVACGTTTEKAPASDTTAPMTSATSTNSAPKPVTYVTLPDTYGQNADAVKTKLQDLGIDKVELASSNAKYSTVDQPKDWKVVGMTPGAGTVVKSDAPVILKVVKVQ